jgi:hypothetical protein
MRTTTLLALTVSALMASGTLAFAASSAPANADKDPNRIVCHKGRAPTGTRLPGPSICHTQAEWDAIRQQSQDQTNELQRQGLTQKIPTGGG